MAQEQTRESFFDRTLSNLVDAWREVSASAARTVGLSAPDSGRRDERALRRLMTECLEARGGEVSARLRAAELGRTYLELDSEGRRKFLTILARDFAVEGAAVERAISAYHDASNAVDHLRAEAELRRALLPPRLRLLTQFNTLPEGVKFLVDLRADLLQVASSDPHLQRLDEDLRELLTSWFDVGFLDLRRITWDSPASLLEKLIAYEAVHEIRDWRDLRNRLQPDRRCYALFHPRMPDEPLAFVEVALVHGMAGSIQALLAEGEALADHQEAADAAIFYSISNTQRGLRGISFGDHLIKGVVAQLSLELPQLRTFATLSPVPGFCVWLDGRQREVLEAALSVEERQRIAKLSGGKPAGEGLRALLRHANWHRHKKVRASLEAPLMRLCARYFLERRENGRPIDPVARFHLKNGARLERINWLGDSSPKGLRQSAGLMVNYSYVISDIEKNHERYMKDGRIALGTQVRSLLKGWRDPDGSSLQRLESARG